MYTLPVASNSLTVASTSTYKRKRYIENGGKLGRKVGSVKTEEQIRTEYREVISLLRKGYSIRDVAKLSGKGVSTVQRVKIIING